MDFKFKINDDIKIKSNIDTNEVIISDFCAGGPQSHHCRPCYKEFVNDLKINKGVVLYRHNSSYTESKMYKIRLITVQEDFWISERFLQLYFELDVKLFKF